MLKATGECEVRAERERREGPGEEEENETVSSNEVVLSIVIEVQLSKWQGLMSNSSIGNGSVERSQCQEVTVAMLECWK